jgi:putative transposase
MDVHFCIEALNKALMNGKPEIFNTDQGSQFTSEVFTSSLLKNNIQISMDSKGRVFVCASLYELNREARDSNLTISLSKGYGVL